MDLTSLIDYKFNINESYLVIGDYSYRDIFLSLKKKNPFLKIKYYSFNELSSFLEYKVDDKIISYIIHNYNDTIDYLKAKELATILININENDNKDNNIYKKLKLEMIKEGIIEKDIYAPLILKRNKILIFEDDFNMNPSLKTLLNKYDINDNDVEFISFKESSNKNIIENINHNKKIKVFRDKNEEYNYIFSYINKLINEENVDPSKIYLYTSKEDPFYLENYSSLYNLKINYPFKRGLLSFKEITSLLNKSYQDKKLYIKEIEDEVNKLIYPSKDNFLSIYDLEKINNFERSYLILKEILSSLVIKTNSSLKAINLITKPIFKDNIYLFITNFEYDTFFKYYKDDNYLFDKELEKLNLTTSNKKTLENKRLMKNFLLFSDALSFSRIKIHLKDKIYPSPFLKELNLKEEVKDGNINLENGLYTSKAKDLVLARYKDDHNFKEDSSYKDYDFNFKGINRNLNEVSFSMSHISDFRECPFKTYLEKELLVNKNFEPTYPIKVGNLYHKFLENIKDKDFLNNYDYYFDKYYKEIGLSEEEAFVLKETTFKYIKYSFEKMDKFVKNELSANNEINNELKMNFEETIDGKKVGFYGQSDLIIKNEKDHHLTVLDYKSGSETIHDKYIKYGFSLQLPLYAIGINSNLEEGEEPYEVTCYIQPLLKKFNKEGKNLSEEKYKNDELKFIKIKEDINKTVLEAKEAYKKIAKDYLNAEFHILPSVCESENDSPCTYCNFKNVCFNKNKLTFYKYMNDDSEE